MNNIEPFPLPERAVADRDPNGWIPTRTGRQFWPFDPRPEDIDIRDIAHALANYCRFTGHVAEHYSVAQHSCLVADLVPDELKLSALMHDASEAYLGDVSTPVKRQLGAVYRDAEDRLSAMIAAKFGLIYPWPEEVRAADRVMAVTERRDLIKAGLPGWIGYESVQPMFGRIVPWSVDKRTAVGVFRKAFRMYGGKS